MKTYSRPERQSIARSLRKLKKHLRTADEVAQAGLNKSTAICYAATRANLTDFEDAQVCNMIMDRISPDSMVPGWLVKNVPDAKRLFELSGEIDQISWAKAVQDYRHQWVDALIEEFSK